MKRASQPGETQKVIACMISHDQVYYIEGSWRNAEVAVTTAYWGLNTLCRIYRLHLVAERSTCKQSGTASLRFPRIQVHQGLRRNPVYFDTESIQTHAVTKEFDTNWTRQIIWESHRIRSCIANGNTIYRHYWEFDQGQQPTTLTISRITTTMAGHICRPTLVNFIVLWTAINARHCVHWGNSCAE